MSTWMCNSNMTLEDASINHKKVILNQLKYNTNFLVYFITMMVIIMVSMSQARTRPECAKAPVCFSMGLKLGPGPRAYMLSPVLVIAENVKPKLRSRANSFSKQINI